MKSYIWLEDRVEKEKVKRLKKWQDEINRREKEIVSVTRKETSVEIQWKSGTISKLSGWIEQSVVVKELEISFF